MLPTENLAHSLIHSLNTQVSLKVTVCASSCMTHWPKFDNHPLSRLSVCVLACSFIPPCTYMSCSLSLPDIRAIKLSVLLLDYAIIKPVKLLSYYIPLCVCRYRPLSLSDMQAVNANVLLAAPPKKKPSALAPSFYSKKQPPPRPAQSPPPPPPSTG
jgi:hypothetical protein